MFMLAYRDRLFVKTLSPGNNRQIAVGTDYQTHGLDITLIELLPLCLAHLCPGGQVSPVEQVLHIHLNGFLQGGVDLLQHGLHLDVVAVAGAEVIDVAVRGPSFFQHCLVFCSKLAVFHHHIVVDRIQQVTQRPIVGIAAEENDGIHVIGVVFLTGFDAQGMIHHGFAAVDASGHQVFHRDIREAVDNIPGTGGVDVVAEEDLYHLILIHIVQGRAELVGVGVLAVHNDDHPAVVLQESMDVMLDAVADIVDLAEILEGVLISCVKQGEELLIVVEDVAFLRVGPVEVDLIGIAVSVGIVYLCCCPDSGFGLAVGHHKQGLDVLPLHPDGKDGLAVIDAVCDQLVDADDVVIDLTVRLDNGDAVCSQLADAVLGDLIREGIQIFQIPVHLIVQGIVVLFDGRAEHGQMPNDPGVLVFLQLMENIQLGSFIVGFEMPLLHTGQIGHLGDDGIGVGLISIGSSHDVFLLFVFEVSEHKNADVSIMKWYAIY